METCFFIKYKKALVTRPLISCNKRNKTYINAMYIIIYPNFK